MPLFIKQKIGGGGWPQNSSVDSSGRGEAQKEADMCHRTPRAREE